jgi:hypothetical protein
VRWANKSQVIAMKSLDQKAHKKPAADVNPAVNLASGLGFAHRIQQRFKGLDGDELLMPKRTLARPVPDFTGAQQVQKDKFLNRF